MKTDPELRRQLDAAHDTNELVEAVLMLTPPASAQMADSAIERVTREVGVSPTAVNVLTNMGVVIVSGNEVFVRKLLDQPEFASATANERYA